MKRTMFNDPRPKGVEEINEAMAELGLDVSEGRAMIDEPGDDGQGGHGWTAEIDAPNEEGDPVTFTTLAYDTRELLVADLEAVGITDIENTY